MFDRRGVGALGLTVAAFAWSLALIVGAFVVPLYSGTAESSVVGSSVGRATLVDVNGVGVLPWVAAPAILTAFVWIALHRQCTRNSRVAGVAASGGVVLLAALTALSLFTIGVFVLPVTVLLAWAVSLTRGRRLPCGGTPWVPGGLR